MNTAAGLIGTQSLQVVQQLPADEAMPVVDGSVDFAAALAAACTAEQPDNSLPDGMQSAAALAWLAGLTALTTASTAASAAGESVQSSAVAGSSVGDDTGPDAIDAMMLVAGLPGLVQPVVASTPAIDSAAATAAMSDESSGIAASAAISVRPAAAAATATAVAAKAASTAAAKASATAAAIAAAAAAAVADNTAYATDAAVASPSLAEANVAPALTAEVAAALPGVINLSAGNAAGRASGGTSGSTARAVSPLALLRALAAPLQDAPIEQGDALAARITAEFPLQADVPAESLATSERLPASLFDRAPVAPGTDVEQPVGAATNPYAGVRDAASVPQVSSQSATIHATVGSPRWGNELGSRLVMMSMRGQQEGSLSLTPEHLGPLEVRISVSQDTTNVWFGSQHADTRAALTEALPRLREMFAASGLALGHAGVSHQTPQQQARRGEFATATGNTDIGDSAEAASIAPVVRQVRSALLDTWA